jgi:hypothetical protein
MTRKSPDNWWSDAKLMFGAGAVFGLFGGILGGAPFSAYEGTAVGFSLKGLMISVLLWGALFAGLSVISSYRHRNDKPRAD